MMATFRHKQGRKMIHFTNHALDQWWARCEQNQTHGRQAAMNLLRQKLETATWEHGVPPWSRLSLWHKARAEGYLAIDDGAGHGTGAFIINRAPDSNLLAVTYIMRPEMAAAA